MASHPPDPPITELLERHRRGDQAAVAQLMPLLYDELHRRAVRLMQGERSDATMQATALVHEAWLQLGHDRSAPFESRIHFVRLASRAMRNVLVDHARRRRRRAGHGEVLPASKVTVAGGEPAVDAVDVLALHEALERLEGKDPQLVQIVELRYFAGLTLAETGDALGLTVRQVHRAWTLARAWLRRELERS